MVNKPPANAGETGLIPSLARVHKPKGQLNPHATTTEAWMPRARVPRQLSLCAATTEVRALQQEKPPQ